MIFKINSKALLNQIVYYSSYSAPKKMDAEELLDFEKRISNFEAEELNSNPKKTPQNLENTKLLNDLEASLIDVYFNDLENKVYKVKLNFNSIGILQKKFDDIVARKDGSFLLHGASAAFVSSWYKDIAYKRNYIEADENKDGLIDKNEALNLKEDFGARQFYLCLDEEGRLNFKFFGVNIYKNLKDNENFKPTTLNLALNESIRLDSDFDGIINYEQASENRADKDLNALAKKILDETKFFELILSDEKFIEKYKAQLAQMFKEQVERELGFKEDEDNIQKEKIRNKILSQGIQNLSIEEKILVQKYFPELSKKQEDNFAVEFNIEEFANLFKDFLKSEKIEIPKGLLDFKI